MTKLLFIEGVSGVGKSTMVRALAEALRTQGYRAKEYVEFDYTNPIDFYCTAYLTLEEYEKLCAEYKAAEDIIRANTVDAGKARLVRYYDEDTPLFEEPLLSELARREFCYKPTRLVPLEDYTSAYVEVWRNFAASLDGTDDFIIFDGSLLHHPINDMMRNYHITGEQALSHVAALLNALGTTQRYIFYLKTDSIGEQLTEAHRNRGQGIPTEKQILFWEERYRNDMMVLGSIQGNYEIYNVSNIGWDVAREKILSKIDYKKINADIMTADELRMKKFGATTEEICLNTLGIHAEGINENVVVSPGWPPERLFSMDDIEQVVESSPLFGFKIWSVKHNGVRLTYIRTGFGAPMMMDALLLLGLTKCKRIIFISSVGALSTEINIGDIVIPEYSASGDGASRYLSNDLLSDAFGEKQYPDNHLFNLLADKTKSICQENNVKWHLGKTLCVDTIVAQYNHLEDIINMGYNSIDMESAVAFKVGKLMGIPVVALLHVSDNSVIDKSLMTDRSTQEEKDYRAFVRNEILPKIVEGVLSV